MPALLHQPVDRYVQSWCNLELAAVSQCLFFWSFSPPLQSSPRVCPWNSRNSSQENLYYFLLNKFWWPSNTRILQSDDQLLGFWHLWPSKWESSSGQRMAIFYTKIFDLFGLCETLDILVQFLNIFCESLCTQVVLWDKSAYMCVYYTIQWILIVFTSQAIQLRKYGFLSKEIIELDRGVSNFFGEIRNPQIIPWTS